MQSSIEFNQHLWNIWHNNENAPMDDILILWSSYMVAYNVRLKTLNEMDGEGEPYNFTQDYHDGNVRAAFADSINSQAYFKIFSSFNYECHQYLNYKSLKSDK